MLEKEFSELLIVLRSIDARLAHIEKQNSALYSVNLDTLKLLSQPDEEVKP